MDLQKTGQVADDGIRPNWKLIIPFLLVTILTFVAMVAGWVGTTMGIMLWLSEVGLAQAINVLAMGAHPGLSKAQRVGILVFTLLLLGLLAAAWYILVFQLSFLLFP